MKLINAFKQYMSHRRAAQELERLTDRDLADLGICRCDIARVVRG